MEALISNQNVEIVRRAYEEGWVDRDPTRLLALAHDEFRLINPAEAVEPGVRHGREELLDTLTSVGTAFDSATHELREVFDAGDSVVVAVKFRARGRSSGVEVVQDECHTW